MADALTYSIEIAVGVCCLGAALGAWKRTRWLGAALVVAGLAAVVHGVVALAAG